jgi:hypothetical protein
MLDLCAPGKYAQEKSRRREIAAAIGKSSSKLYGTIISGPFSKIHTQIRHIGTRKLIGYETCFLTLNGHALFTTNLNTAGVAWRWGIFCL